MKRVIIIGEGITGAMAVAALQQLTDAGMHMAIMTVDEAIAIGDKRGSVVETVEELNKSMHELFLSIKELEPEEETTIRADQREQEKNRPKVKKFKNHHQHQQRFKRVHKTRNR